MVATNRGRVLSLWCHEAPSMTCIVTKRGETGGDHRHSYNQLLSTNCTISHIPTRYSGGWKISSDGCKHNVSHGRDSECREEDYWRSPVHKPHGSPPWSCATAAERLPSSRGEGVINYVPCTQCLPQLGQCDFCDNPPCCSQAVFDALG